jgi:hypothetical protein
MIKSAGKLAFIVGTDKYVTGIEGSIPVLVKSVSKNLLLLQSISFYAMCIKRRTCHFRETGLTPLRRSTICS